MRVSSRAYPSQACWQSIGAHVDVTTSTPSGVHAAQQRTNGRREFSNRLVLLERVAPSRVFSDVQHQLPSYPRSAAGISLRSARKPELAERLQWPRFLRIERQCSTRRDSPVGRHLKHSNAPDSQSPPPSGDPFDHARLRTPDCAPPDTHSTCGVRPAGNQAGPRSGAGTEKFLKRDFQRSRRGGRRRFTRTSP